MQVRSPGIPGDCPEKEMEPTPVFLSGKFLAGYSPWGCKESDMTEGMHACMHAHTHTHTPLPDNTLISISSNLKISNYVKELEFPFMSQELFPLNCYTLFYYKLVTLDQFQQIFIGVALKRIAWLHTSERQSDTTFMMSIIRLKPQRRPGITKQ